jgi:hypothetical protein
MVEAWLRRRMSRKKKSSPNLILPQANYGDEPKPKPILTNGGGDFSYWRYVTRPDDCGYHS